MTLLCVSIDMYIVLRAHHYANTRALFTLTCVCMHTCSCRCINDVGSIRLWCIYIVCMHAHMLLQVYQWCGLYMFMMYLHRVYACAHALAGVSMMWALYVCDGSVGWRTLVPWAAGTGASLFCWACSAAGTAPRDQTMQDRRRRRKKKHSRWAFILIRRKIN